MDNQLDMLLKRGRNYWFVDGFTEIMAGVLFFMMGGALILRGISPQATLLDQLAAMIREIGLIKLVGFLAAALLLWVLKDRFTYRRTGFVRGKRVSMTQLVLLARNAVLMVLFPAISFLLAFFLLPAVRNTLFSASVWLPFLLGSLWAVLCFVAGEWIGLPRFRWIALGICIAGIVIAIWQYLLGLPATPVNGIDPNPWLAIPGALQAPLAEVVRRIFSAVGTLTLVTGVILLLSGIVTFFRYRKENPVPYQEEA
jgi:hypothetical protein